MEESLLGCFSFPVVVVREFVSGTFSARGKKPLNKSPAQSHVNNAIFCGEDLLHRFPGRNG